MSATHYEAGARVVVVAAVDSEVHDVSRHIGAGGRVARLIHDHGCGEVPGDPMHVVDLDSGEQEAFWREELAEEGAAA